MEITFNLKEYQSKLTKIAQDAPKPFSGRSTGALKASIKVEVTGGEQGDLISIKFNNYGLFVDSGVLGTKGGSTGKGYAGTAYKFKDKKDRFGRPAPVGGRLPYGARVNIRKFGVPAKPWIKNMLRDLEEELVRDIALELPAEIEKKIADILSTLK